MQGHKWEPHIYCQKCVLINGTIVLIQLAPVRKCRNVTTDISKFGCHCFLFRRSEIPKTKIASRHELPIQRNI